MSDTISQTRTEILSELGKHVATNLCYVSIVYLCYKLGSKYLEYKHSDENNDKTKH